MRRGVAIAALLLTVATRVPADAAPSAEITGGNAFANERHWPYYVSLIESWAPPGERPLTPGLNAVLVRVEPNGFARIDFGRDGLFEVPVAKTDLAARANAIRSGREPKTTPNFTFAIGPRLVSSAGPELRAFPLDALANVRAYLCVFADPRSASFEAVARSIEARAPRADVAVLFFPQGDVPDADVSERLRSLGAPVPFLWNHLSEPYTATLLSAEPKPPRWLLLSAEGRRIAEGAWGRRASARIEAALSAELATGGAQQP